MIVQNLKGFRDFLPNDAKKRNYVLDVLKNVFISYGFQPLETPTLEYEDILTGKYGDEGDKLMYRFTDNGDRRVAMRYDQTVPLARVISQYQNEIPLPFKRFQIQNVFRAENTQKGRYREFLQVDIDSIGVKDVNADAEIISIISSCLEKLNVGNFKILVNDRNNFEGIPDRAIIIVDKLKKIGEEKVYSELLEKGFDKNILDIVKSSTPTENLKKIINSSIKLGVKEENIKFEPTLARGLDYYTGLIIEVEIEEYKVGSIGGGGRYDKLIGMFSGKEIPAVGFAFGFDRLIEALSELNLFPNNLGEIKVLISIPGIEYENKAFTVSKILREKNISYELWLDSLSGLDKQLKYANKKNTPFVLIFDENKILIKNMKTGIQKEISIDNLPDEIR